MAHLQSKLSMNERHSLITIRDCIVSKSTINNRLNMRATLQRLMSVKIKQSFSLCSSKEDRTLKKSSKSELSSSSSCTLADWQVHRYLQQYLSIRDKSSVYETVVSLDFLEWILHTIDLHESNKCS